MAVTTMNILHRVLPSTALRWFKEPLLHFFVIGAALFVVHHACVGEPRTIVVTAGVRAHVARRFKDRTGRPPSSTELTKALADWKREEALYREALRDGLEREDATVRTVLADKVRARAALQIPTPQPTTEELERWLEMHRDLYETPRRYEYELLTFATTASGRRELEQYEQTLAAGKEPSQLGRPLLGGTLTLEALRSKFGANMAEGLAGLPLGRWQRFEGAEQWSLARVKRTLGGLPSAEELRPRLTADWSRDAEQRAVERAVQQIVDGYRFEERP
jgi:hypothetical protein